MNWFTAALFMGRASVRSRLVGLAMLLLLPGLAIAALLTLRTYQAERAGAETALRETARGLDQLVDREFVQAEVLLRTLAATEELEEGDLAAFDRLARATAVMHGGIVLVDRTGRELIDTRLPRNAVLPHDRVPQGWDQETLGEAFISPLFKGENGTFVLVVLPVGMDGKHVYDLQLIVPGDSLQAMLTRQHLPQGWIASILDARNTLVARNSQPVRFVGRAAGPELRDDLAVADEGIRDAVAIDGAPVVMAYSRSQHSHWTVAVASPHALVGQTARKSTSLLILLEGIAVAIAIAGALRVARGIAGPIEAIANAARRLGESETLPPIRGGLIEADDVAHAMRTASRTLIERRQAMTELNDTLAARVDARTSELAMANRALEEQRSRLDEILGQMPIGVLVHDYKGRVLLANREARRLLDLAPDDPVNALPNYELKLLSNGDAPLTAEQCPAARARSGEVTERELFQLERSDGARIDIEVSAGPLYDAEGRVALSVTTAQDVSARLEAEEARRRSQRLEAVGQLTGGVAHEFNNLLMAISGCLDLLGPHVPQGRPAMLVANASRATDRGARLTSQLLAFSRRQHLRAEPVDLNALVLGMSELLQGTLGRGTEVVTRLDPAAWTAMADAPQLELVLLNLAINARDAMGGGGTVEIGTQNTVLVAPSDDPPPGDYVALIVTDTGEGMTPQVLARAFEPFFTTKDVGRGSGLGLPQVLGTAQQLGGGVRISSTRGFGTTVRVLLPRAMARPSWVPVPVLPEQAPEELRGARLLLVDDDADVREIARGMLESLGAIISEADDGPSALLLLRTGVPVDIVLADLTMPQMTGIDLAREIHAVQPHLPVILMTGYSATAVNDISPHVRATLQKPFRSDALAKLLVIELARAQAAQRERNAAASAQVPSPSPAAASLRPVPADGHH